MHFACVHVYFFFMGIKGHQRGQMVNFAKKGHQNHQMSDFKHRWISILSIDVIVLFLDKTYKNVPVTSS